MAVVTDAVLAGQPVVGYGFASIGRYAQSGLIRERFAPRLLRAAAREVSTDGGANLDPLRAWTVMMTSEKPGGHGERCVAVGAIDMALWDAAAKIAGMPLHRFLVGRLSRNVTTRRVPVSPALPVDAGHIGLPDIPGIGFELHDNAWQAFRSLI